MPVKRRSPGQRRRRTRREDELRQVAELYPDRVPELEELRKYNPQAFRKELLKLIRKGRILRGRGFEVPDSVLALLDLDLSDLRREVEAGLASEDLDFRALAGLLQEEKTRRARPDVLGWLGERYQALLDEDNRYVP